MRPPRVVFVTPIVHVNIHAKTGEICTDILKEGWSPAWSISSVCLAILTLLENGDASSPLNPDAGNLVRSGDDRGFKSLAKFYRDTYADPPK